MRQNGRQAEKACFLIDARGLDCRDLMPTKTFPDDVQSARQRGIAEGAVGFARKGGADGGDKGFLWIGQLHLRLGKRRRNGGD
jgi:hypothetical protein